MYLNVVTLLRAFDGHGRPRVFSFAHLCKRTAMENSLDAYLPLENVPGRYDAMGFAELRKQQQTPWAKSVIKGRMFDKLGPANFSRPVWGRGS